MQILLMDTFTMHISFPVGQQLVCYLKSHAVWLGRNINVPKQDLTWDLSCAICQLRDITQGLRPISHRGLLAPKIISKNFGIYALNETIQNKCVVGYKKFKMAPIY